MYTPIWTALKKYKEKNNLAMHVPGHKRGKLYRQLEIDFPTDLLSFDTTEIEGIDNLHQPNTSIKEAQDIAAKIFKARSTFFLVNGSTVGNIAMLMSVTKPNDKVIIPRNAHKSVISGAILGGLDVIYVMPHEGVIRPCDVEELLKKNKDVVALLITSPTYYGICSNMEALANIVHAREVLFLVDEAHGSHFVFHEKLPMSAIELGADMAVCSTHKTLGAMTGASMLHIGSNRVYKERVQEVLGMLQTSSPSHIMLASLDISVAIMQEMGHELLDNLINNCINFRENINKIEGLSLIYGETIDITRLTINVSGIGITGNRCAEILRDEYNIELEMYDEVYIVAVATIADTKEDLDNLLIAIKEVASKYKGEVKKIYTNVYSNKEKMMTLGKAFYSKKSKINLEDSVGRVAGEMIIPYPPGIPILMPGEKIDEECIKEIQNYLFQKVFVYGIISNQITIVIG